MFIVDFVSLSRDCTEQYPTKGHRNVGFVYIKRSIQIKLKTKQKSLVRLFKLTALGLNEPLNSLACFVRRMENMEREGGGGVK